MARVLAVLTNLFPAWVVLASLASLAWPDWIAWFDRSLIPWALSLVMLGMGVTLTVDDFRQVMTMPRAILTGFVGQYVIMPSLGWCIAKLLRLDTPFAVGLILVACCPGGTASNLVTWLARGNVALSVLMTMCTTFAAVVMTPFLTKWLAGSYAPVAALPLLVDTIKVVLAPLAIGLALNHWTPRLVRVVLPVAPFLSAVTIALIVASTIGSQAERIRESGGRLLLAVGLLHVGGFGFGWLFAALFGYGETVRRTIAIEVGMQNSGLGVALAQKNFPNLPAAPVPCAISAVFHSVIGSVLAGLWRIWPAKN